MPPFFSVWIDRAKYPQAPGTRDRGKVPRPSLQCLMREPCKCTRFHPIGTDAEFVGERNVHAWQHRLQDGNQGAISRSATA